MTDTTPTVQQQDGDRLSVSDAATRLGVTPDAIRARLRRGTLEGGKDGDSWYVVLPPESADTTTDRDRQDDDTTATALVEQLRGEVAYLRGELTAAREQAARERERADVIQREALDRIQHMLPSTVGRQDAPSASPGSPERVETDAGGERHQSDDHPPQGTLWARLRRVLLGN